MAQQHCIWAYLLKVILLPTFLVPVSQALGAHIFPGCCRGLWSKSEHNCADIIAMEHLQLFCHSFSCIVSIRIFAFYSTYSKELNQRLLKRILVHIYHRKIMPVLGQEAFQKGFQGERVLENIRDNPKVGNLFLVAAWLLCTDLKNEQ